MHLALAYIRARALGAALNVLLLALGIGTIVLLLLVSAQLEDRLTRDARGIDLVVGAKGSPLQLVLASVYHVDIPTGNIPLAEARRLDAHPLVETVIPLALGDSLGGFRIVGTEPAYPAHYDAGLAAGRLWQAPFEATLGAEVARSLDLGIGDRFVGSHGLAPGGLAHGDHPYEVVGILEPSRSVVDRLVLTSIASVWAAHGIEGSPDRGDDDHEDGEEAHDHGHDDEEVEGEPDRQEVTALLLRYGSPLAAISLPREINRETTYQAASPALEVVRLLSLVGVGIDALRGFGLLLMATAGLSVFIALSQAMQERRYDLALMRTLGASRRTLLLQPLTEGLLLAGAGVVLGLLLGHGATELLGHLVADLRAMGLTGGMVVAGELWLLGLAFGVGALASIVPAIQAYRTEIAPMLASRA